jgi:hypothetical protein
MSRSVPQPDFLRPVARPGWLAWAWCGTGLLVLAVSAADSHAAWQARQLAQDRLARVQMAPVRANQPTALPGSSQANNQANSQRTTAQARRAEADRWQQQLALPWPAVWAASEAAPAGVQWLLFDHGSAGGLRLAGLAQDQAAGDAAADAVRQQLHAGRPAWQGVVLAAVERVPDGQRFELVARLAGQGVGPAVGPAQAAAASGPGSRSDAGALAGPTAGGAAP